MRRVSSHSPAPGPVIPPSLVRVPALSYFFPAHDEEANLEPLVE
jgi:hypothetical protein